MGKLAYDPALDGLRCFAVVAVVLLHMNSNLFPGGWIGVDVFFVLSGYLITSILRDEIVERGTVDLWRFYWHRFLRLMPPLWCLLLCLLPIILIKHPAELKAWLFAATYTMNWNRALDLGPQYLLGHTWSLAAEEQFYLLWPAAFLFLRRRKPVAWLLGMVVGATLLRYSLAALGAPTARTYNGFFTHSDPILLGCILALLEIPEPIACFCSRFYWLWIAAFIIFAVTVAYGNWFGDTVGISLSGLTGAALLIASREGPARRILKWRPAVFTGKISYDLYLWHYPLLMWGKLSPAVALATAYLIATVSYFTVERYFRRLKGRPPAPEPLAITG